MPSTPAAAELGNTNAMSIYDSMFLLGQDLSEDGKETEIWLKHAAQSGDRNAVSLLGIAMPLAKQNLYET